MDQQSQLRRLGLFEARAPRYTSYPPATQFSAEVGDARFREWLAAIPPESAISVYLHVPFCRRLCWFCACRTQGTQSDDPVLAYAETLLAEIEMLSRALPPGVRLSRLHWGGGTPTLLPAATMRRVSEAIFAVLPLAEGAEFSVEIDPNEIDEARVVALAASGMNRASIGVQDFNPEIQKTIGRDQSLALTRHAVEMLRAYGVGSVNADILYGLPHQDPVRIARTVEQVLTLAPERIALYGYAHVPWMAKRQVMIPTEALPDPEARLLLFDTARRLLCAEGYDEIGIDHFALPRDRLALAHRNGTLRRNFQGYTDDGAEVLVGLGASSISRFPQGYAQNAAATPAHVAAVRAGRFSTARGHAFTAEDRWRGRMIESLMSDFGIDMDEFTSGHGLTREEVESRLAPLAAEFDGFVRVNEAGLRILPEGRPLTRIIAGRFDAYEMAARAHSSAI